MWKYKNKKMRKQENAKIHKYERHLCFAPLVLLGAEHVIHCPDHLVWLLGDGFEDGIDFVDGIDF